MSGQFTAGKLSRAEAVALAKAAAAGLAEMDRLTEKYGEEPKQDGSVVRFTKHFPGTTWTITPVSSDARDAFRPKTYLYAAIRVADKWWTTGPKSSGGFDWEELLAFIDEGSQHEDRVEILSHGYKTTQGEIVTGPQTERHPGYQQKDDPSVSEVDWEEENDRHGH